MGVALFERDLELRAGRTFLEASPARALVIDGPAGIGKTAVLRSVIEIARGDGHLVLECTADSAEVRLTFVGLADLFGTVADEVLDQLPTPQAHALEVALLRADAESPGEPHAVAAGVLSTLRALAERQQVLVAIDDIQWLDGASAEAITFAARRLSSSRVRFLLARRPRTPTQLERAIEPDLTRLSVAPLSLGSMRRMLKDRLGLTLPRHLLSQIFGATLGNPLFALEFGRTLAEQGLPALGEELPMPETVEALLGARVTGLPRPVHRLLLALALGGDLDTSKLAGIAEPGTVDEASERGLVVADVHRVRASHPLLAAAIKKQSKGRERRELHLTLASVAADEALRAHHLALASRQPDEKLAEMVAGAAGRAFARGARREAAELGEHAIRLTPTGSADRPERLLAQASYLETVGEAERLAALLTDNLESIPSGPQRARAWLHLAEAIYEHLDDYRQCLERARTEAAADPALHASIVARMSSAVISVERIAEAEARALEVLPAAENAGPDVERAVLFALAWARALRGRAIDEVCERWNALSATPGHLAVSPERVAGQRHVWRGELDQARVVFERLLTRSDERGEVISYIWARLHICELALRVGDWQTAQRLLDEWEETAEREFFVEPYHKRCRALLAAGRGLPDEALRWSADTIGRAEAIDFQWDWLEGLRARGIVALLVGEPVHAVQSLRLAWEHITREGVDEPGVFPVAPDLVEALVELGEVDQAHAVTSRLQVLAEQQGHPWGLATARRCSALRKWGAARRSLELAARTFDEIGSTGWADRARFEIDRIGARRPGRAGELTSTERRVVELAANGRSNKEIAQALFVAISTVEGHLSRAYGKLGVRSRAQLAHQVTRDGFPEVQPKS